MQAILEVMDEVSIPANTRIIQQGEDGDEYYIVAEGGFDVFISKDKNIETSNDRADEICVAHFGVGGYDFFPLKKNTRKSTS